MSIKTKTIPSWSFSTWNGFSKCKFRTKCNKIDKLPTTSGPAAKRGNRVHDNAEAHMLKEEPLKDILINWAAEFKKLKRIALKADSWNAEQEWAFTKKWKIISWNAQRAWARAKLDFHYVKGIKGTCIDYKTGRVYPSHEDQMDLYALMMFLKFPMLEFVTCELWYIDQDFIESDVYVRSNHYNSLWNTWTERGLDITTCTEFPATPGDCQWCDFAKTKG